MKLYKQNQLICSKQFGIKFFVPKKNLLKKNNIKIYIIFFTMLFTLYSCKKVSYPKDKIEESAIKILKKDYKLDGKAKYVENTLYLEIELPELFSPEVENLTKKALEKLQGAVMTVVRISLSSDAEIDFVVTIAKIKDYNFCVQIIERIRDVKDFLYLKISRSNYEKRLIMELVPYDSITYKNITLKEFVARLIVSRYNMILKTNPFLAALLNNTTLEFKLISGDLMVLVASNYVSNGVADLFRSILEKYYIEVVENYKLITFPPVLKIEDIKNNEIMTFIPKTNKLKSLNNLIELLNKSK